MAGPWFLLMVDRGSVGNQAPASAGRRNIWNGHGVDSEPIDFGAKPRISIQPALLPPHAVGVYSVIDEGPDLGRKKYPGSSRPLLPRLVNNLSSDPGSLTINNASKDKIRSLDPCTQAPRWSTTAFPPCARP
jgi:hypothetical protein